MKAQNIIIFEPSNMAESNALKDFAKALKLKFSVKAQVYNQDFVAKIAESEKQIAAQDYQTINRDDLSKYLGL